MKLIYKLVLEFLPLGLFFVFTERYDVYVGTAVMMGTTVISMAIIWWIWRSIALMALITAATGLLFGAMTIYWTDPLFVKLKPTIVGFLFASILLGGLMINKPLLKPLLGEDLNLTEKGWRAVTWRWMWYFIFVAFLNEAVWRGANLVWPDAPRTATEFWAAFKAFGLMPITILYGLWQIPLVRRHRLPGAPVDHTFDAIADFFDGTYRHSGSTAREPASLRASQHETE
ncbi:MAG: inner membrane-spanning protein YciB [Hyphomicrobiaceae bacterium]